MARLQEGLKPLRNVFHRLESNLLRKASPASVISIDMFEEVKGDKTGLHIARFGSKAFVFRDAWFSDTEHTRSLKRRSFSYGNPSLVGTNNTCWNCDSSISGPFFCNSCFSILPVQSLYNYFKIFGIEPTFSIDVEDLEKKYKNLQKKLHPDLFGLKSEVEKAFSAEQSAHVINAYYTLLRPLSRAKYLLKLRGKDVKDESTLQDQSLLSEIMEIREAIEDATTNSELQILLEENKKKMAICESQLEKEFWEENLNEATSLIQRLSYLNRIENELKDKM